MTKKNAIHYDQTPDGRWHVREWVNGELVTDKLYISLAEATGATVIMLKRSISATEMGANLAAGEPPFPE